ncbi:hypothetical protein [Corynebacterium glutamicum]|uniref:hypothetical protein n=1 Tax=Corynebacterium glutamicum TaxID=1718 RepID=UPI0007C5FD9C|nr:hypothetical protein [Corynebacterium glutamicum]ANE07812.1 hypothetical protein A3654_05165 [Corynebacterium glutamicum]
MTDLSRNDVLEDVVDAATTMMAFYAAERIENRGAIEYLATRMEDLEKRPPEPQSPKSSVISELESAQATIQTLQKAVKDHTTAAHIADEKLRASEQDLQKTRETAETAQSRMETENNNLLELVQKQKKMIEDLRKPQVAPAQPNPIDEPAVLEDQLTDIEAELLRKNEDLKDRIRKIRTHLRRGLKKFDEEPDVTLRAIDYSLKLAEKI